MPPPPPQLLTTVVEVLECWFRKIIVLFKEMLSKKTVLHIDKAASPILQKHRILYLGVSQTEKELLQHRQKIKQQRKTKQKQQDTIKKETVRYISSTD